MWFRFSIYVFFIAILSSACSSRQVRKVLVIHSYEATYAAYPDFNKMIAGQFRKQKIDAEIVTFYLDCEKYNEQPEIERMYYFLDSIADWKPEIIIVNEDQATYSLLKTFHPIVKQIPVVFAGVNYPNWELIGQYPNVTGWHDKIDFITNIQVARELSGNKQVVFTILDNTFLDRKVRSDFMEQFEDCEIYACNDSVPLDIVNKKIEEGYIVFRTVAARGGQQGAGFLWRLSKFAEFPYLQVKRDFTTMNVCAIASNICFSAINETFGYDENILGGYMTPMSVQVEEEVDVAARILNGEKPENIPICESQKVYLLDWKVMVGKGIVKELVPTKYTIINMPFYERNPLLWGGILLVGIGLLTLLFTWLIFLYRREAKRRRQTLRELEGEREALALAIQGGNTYAWSFKKGIFEIESAFWEAQEVAAKKLTVAEFAHFVHIDYQQEFERYSKHLSILGKYSIELKCDFNGRGYQWWELRYSTMPGSSGDFVTTGLFMNIQDLKLREQELIEARELAEQAELKQSFLANMSHEIRTPLNAIVGFSNILTSTENIDEVERKLYIDVINTNSELLLKLINDILELSRIESGYMTFRCEKCLVNDLIDEVYSTHQVLMPSCLQFIKETEENDLQISVDRGRLTQVLTNFLNNAGKFTFQGYIKLGSRYIPEDGEVHIYVEDSGKGISKAEQQIIFNRFYKQDEFAQGTGLGLSICKVIIERLNGRIEVWSEIGKGSCFTVILPCKKLDQGKSSLSVEVRE